MTLLGHLFLQGLCFLLSTVVGAQALELRLVNGGHRCEGRVEMNYQGTWSVLFDKYWSLREAAVVCRQLNCGTAVSALKGAPFGPGVGLVWLGYLHCSGTELTLNDCSHSKFQDFRNNAISHYRDAGVVCSGFTRLVGGDGPCSGRVEVYSRGKWIPVSDGNFTFLTAQVICAELRCNKAASVLRGMPFRESDRLVWDEEFWCEGQESDLWMCPKVPCPGSTCHHSGAVHIVCSAYTEVRLIKNGISQCEGQVQMHVSGHWRPLCASHWTMANAHVVCRQLGCGVALSAPKGTYTMGGGDQVWKTQFHCSGAESFLWKCPVTALGAPDCSPGNTASVICSGNQTQVLPLCTHSLAPQAGAAVSQKGAPRCSDSPQLRLVDGGHPCAGRVEILHQGSWGTVCDDGWDLRDAHVVCRQLGCGEALNATVSAHFGPGSGPIWLEELQCTGNETHMLKCPSLGWGRHDCRHKEDAGVICSDFLTLRMVSEDQECAGWLEVFYNGTWGSVCSSPMEAMTLSMICKQLGCGDTGNLDDITAVRKGSRPQWVDGIRCQKTDTSLWQCHSDPWKYSSCSSVEEASITCAGKKPKSCPSAAPCTDKEKLRLRGGESRCSGRVEVWHNGSWGTVCDDSWDLADAHVVCAQLGCGSALDAPRAATFGPGNGSIWLDEVHCRGREDSLWACAAEPWGQSDCKHEEDAGVRCSGERTRTSLTLPAGTNLSLNLVPGLFSLPGILCFILGALLFLVLIFLGTQLHRRRAERRDLSAFEDAVDEALYEEIDDLASPKEDPLGSPGFLLSDSETKLSCYTGDGENSDYKHAPDPTAQIPDAPCEGYDDADYVPEPRAPLTSGISERNVSLEEENRMKLTQTDSSLKITRGPVDSNKGEGNSWLPCGENRDTGYDDVE